MAQTLVYGTATVYGAQGSVVVTGNAATAGYVVNSVDASNEAEIEYHKDSMGNEIGMGVKNRKKTINLDLYPTGSTITNAAGGLKVPEIPALVTLAGFTATYLNGTYAYVGGGSVSQNESVCKITMPLTQWSGSTAASMTTAATE